VSGGGKGDPGKSPMSDGGKAATPQSQMLTIARPSKLGTRGRPIKLLTNHFKVSGKPPADFFYHYNVHAS
jgi:hypothetical protein